MEIPFNSTIRKLALYLVTILLVAFLILSILVFSFPINPADREFSEEVQELNHQVLDHLMIWISFPGYFPRSVILIGVTSLILLINRYPKEAFFMLLTSISGVISTGIKLIINRPRPSADLVNIIEQAEGMSFPSGHVTFYVIFFGFLALLCLRLKRFPRAVRFIVLAISLFMILSVPLSRTYLGAHWFTDVLGGFLIGSTYLVLLIMVYLKYTENRHN